MNNSNLHDKIHFIIERLKLGFLILLLVSTSVSFITSYFFSRISYLNLGQNYRINTAKELAYTSLSKTIKTIDTDVLLEYYYRPGKLNGYSKAKIEDKLENRIVSYATDKNLVIIDLKSSKIYGAEDISHDLFQIVDKK